MMTEKKTINSFDMHSHILFGVDHGAVNIDVSKNLLSNAQDIGCVGVALTPHYYHHRRSLQSFLEKREKSLQEFKAMADLCFPELKIVVGAEVALESGLLENFNKEMLKSLCYENTNVILLEMPHGEWRNGLVESVYDIIAMGFRPIIAHIDRYTDKQADEILELSPTVQVNADAFSDFFKRRKMIKLYEKGKIHVIGSDAHDLDQRNYNNFSKALNKFSPEMFEYFYNNSKKILSL